MKSTLLVLLAAQVLGGQPSPSDAAHDIPSAATEEPAVAVHLRAHRELLSGDQNAAACRFAGAADGSTAAWLVWARRFAAARPDLAVAHYLLGDAEARVQRWDAALDAFAVALRLNPGFAPARNARGVVLALNGKFGPALLDLRAAARDAALRGEALTNTGFVYIAKKGPAAGALKAFDEALTASPDLALASAGRGLALAAGGQFDGSHKVLAATARRPGCFAALLDDNVTRLAAWVAEQDDLRLAGLTPDEVGSTFNRELIKGLNGDPKGITNATRIAAENKELQPKLTKALNTINTNRPDTQKAIVKGLTAFENKAATQKFANDVKAAIKVTLGLEAKAGGQVGVPGLKVAAGGKNGVGVEINPRTQAGASIGASAGVTLDLKKAMLPAQAKDQANTQLVKDLKQNVAALKNNVGGVTTDLSLAYVDRGDWPLSPMFALGYPAPAGGAQ